MATCAVCRKRSFLRPLHRRLAIPEYRAMTGFWPWLQVRVGPECVDAYDRDFLERLRLLAPQVLENDEPIVGRVCLACGRVDAAGPWRKASKWIDSCGRPVRRATFHLCREHAGAVYVEGIVVSSNLAGRMGEVLDELPAVPGDLLDRVEGWRPQAGWRLSLASRLARPAGAETFADALTRQEAVALADRFWSETGDLEARAAWLGPVRKDYGLRYRLDLARDLAAGRRDVLVVLRTAPDRFAAYRTHAARPTA
jgi:hypothetical protein